MIHRAWIPIVLAAALAWAALAARADSSYRPMDIQMGGGNIRADVTPGQLAVSRNDLVAWVGNAARAVTEYYGRFPVRNLHIRIHPVRGHGVGGTAYGYNHRIDIRLGRSAGTGVLYSDWVMTHEMVHMAFPDVSDAQVWLAEGLASYVEPVARAQIDRLTRKQVWAQFLNNMPKGEPRPGDHGLDYTHTWARTYWGGAMFCLLADVKIRKQTHNRAGLQDALRAILAAGGTLDRQWPVTKALRIGDRAVGVNVLEKLYRRLRAKPVQVDLADLWHRLGVKRGLTSIFLANNAPESAIRRAILSPKTETANRAGTHGGSASGLAASQQVAATQ